jgi:hypothetical protein
MTHYILTVRFDAERADHADGEIADNETIDRILAAFPAGFEITDTDLTTEDLES